MTKSIGTGAHTQDSVRCLCDNSFPLLMLPPRSGLRAMMNAFRFFCPFSVTADHDLCGSKPHNFPSRIGRQINSKESCCGKPAPKSSQIEAGFDYWHGKFFFDFLFLHPGGLTTFLKRRPAAHLASLVSASPVVSFRSMRFVFAHLGEPDGCA